MARSVALAVDLGASGGRVVAGLFDGRLLELEELHRFENGPVASAGGSSGISRGSGRRGSTACAAPEPGTGRR